MLDMNMNWSSSHVAGVLYRFRNESGWWSYVTMYVMLCIFCSITGTLQVFVHGNGAMELGGVEKIFKSNLAEFEVKKSWF